MGVTVGVGVGMTVGVGVGMTVGVTFGPPRPCSSGPQPKATIAGRINNRRVLFASIVN